jgi:hypothetical protein
LLQWFSADLHELRLLARVANSMTREQAKAYISICDRFRFLCPFL